MKVLYISLFILVADQFTKLKVKGISIPFLNIFIPGMPYQSTIKVFDYFDITYIENPGMAFGLTVVNKLFLSLFTLFATIMIFYFIYKNRKESLLFRLALAFILGGAVGNLIDRTFYGVWYGYAPLFFGRVVDFMHINVPDVRIFGKTIYNWPIFNIADIAVTAGFILILFGYKKMFKKPEPGPVILPAVPEGNYFLLKDQDGNVIEQRRSEVETHDDHTSFSDKFEHVETPVSKTIVEKFEDRSNKNDLFENSNDLYENKSSSETSNISGHSIQDPSYKKTSEDKFSDEMFEGKIKEDPEDLNESNLEMKTGNLADLKKIHEEINNDQKDPNKKTE